MQWDDTLNHGFSKADAKDLYLPQDTAEDAPTVAGQQKEPDSILNTVKAILAIRNSHDELKDNANLELAYAKNDERAFAYRRGSMLMLCNPSDVEIVLSYNALSTNGEKLYEIGNTACRGNEYVLGVQSFGIYKL